MRTLIKQLKKNVFLFCVCSLTLLVSGNSLAAYSEQCFPKVAAIVEKQGAVVVNISATTLVQRSTSSLLQDDQVDSDGSRQRPKSSTSPHEEQLVGSGFIISSDGYVLTNAHVVEGASDIIVRLIDRQEFSARLIGVDKRTDIALLKLDATGLPYAVLGDIKKVHVGDGVIAIGSPFGFDSSVTTGIVSAKDRALPNETLVPFIQTDVAVNPGNSGGPLFNLKGEVVGINSQIYSRSGGFMGISFAIPIDVAMQVQAQLRQNGQVVRGRIGVIVQDVNKEVAESFKLPKMAGALVGGTEAGSPAEKAGIKVGDIFLRFEDKVVTNSIDLPRIVSVAKPGSVGHAQIWRHGALIDVPIEVAQIPEDKKKELVPVPQEILGANQLGMLVQDLAQSQKKSLQLAQGASIRSTTGASSRAALHSGDVVIAVIVQGDRIEVTSAEQFNRTINTLRPATAVTLLVRRGYTQSFVGLRIPAKK